MFIAITNNCKKMRLQMHAVHFDLGDLQNQHVTASIVIADFYWKYCLHAFLHFMSIVMRWWYMHFSFSGDTFQLDCICPIFYLHWIFPLILFFFVLVYGLGYPLYSLFNISLLIKKIVMNSTWVWVLISSKWELIFKIFEFISPLMWYLRDLFI